MTGQLKYFTFEIDMGWMGILSGEQGVLATTLPQSTEDEARRQLGQDINQAVFSADALASLAERFKSYFSGAQIEFANRCFFPRATPFQVSVWQAARHIPYGETRSYGWVARRMGKPAAARAVGQALGKNPVPIIVPCHRVVAGDSSLGGFTGGLQLKIKLLELETGEFRK